MTQTDQNWRGRVLVWDEQAIFLGLAGEAILHESPAIKVCVALGGSFGLRSKAEDEWTAHDSAVISAGEPHAIDGRNLPMAMLLLVPETPLAQPLAPYFSHGGISQLPAAAVRNVEALFRDLEARLADEFTHSLCDEMITAIAPGGTALQIDSRVAQSIEWIRSSRDRGISVQEIAAGVELSESRFSHLFTENVRIPVRRYLLWLRLRDSMHLLAQGRSLTETAHEAGFSDSAHLTRTFRNMLGIAPSALVRESTIVSFLQ